MNNINWNDYYSKTTLKSRRDYLRNVFKDKQKKINKKLFVVIPIELQEGGLTSGQSIRKRARQIANLLRRLARHIILPFPITWTHKNSDRLVQKGVISIEDYIMGHLSVKDFLSALRIGVSQYPNFLFGGVFTLVGLAATLVVATTASFGLAIPILAFCVGLAYIAYASMRAIRKPKTLVAYLKSKMLNERQGHKVEQLFVKMYTLVNILEKGKKTIQRNSLSEAKKNIEASINNEILDIFYEGKYKNIVNSFSKLVEGFVNPFIEKMNLSDDISSNVLFDDLNKLIDGLEKIDIFEKFEKIEQKNESRAGNIETVTSSMAVAPHLLHGMHNNMGEERFSIPCRDIIFADEKENREEPMMPRLVIASEETSLAGISIKVNTKNKSNKAEELLHRLAESSSREMVQKNVRSFEEKLPIEEKLLIRKVVKVRIKKLMNEGEFDDATILSTILQRGLKRDKSNKSFVMQEITDSVLPIGYKFSLIRELEEKISKISSKSFLSNGRKGINYNGSIPSKKLNSHNLVRKTPTLCIVR